MPGDIKVDANATVEQVKATWEKQLNNLRDVFRFHPKYFEIQSLFDKWRQQPADEKKYEILGYFSNDKDREKVNLMFYGTSEVAKRIDVLNKIASAGMESVSVEERGLLGKPVPLEDPLYKYSQADHKRLQKIIKFPEMENFFSQHLGPASQHMAAVVTPVVAAAKANVVAQPVPESGVAAAAAGVDVKQVVAPKPTGPT